MIIDIITIFTIWGEVYDELGGGPTGSGGADSLGVLRSLGNGGLLVNPDGLLLYWIRLFIYILLFGTLLDWKLLYITWKF